jgi:hypothetical protein
MLSIKFRKINPGKADTLRAWFRELERRKPEVLETFVGEGVKHEQAFILEFGAEKILVYASEPDDSEAASKAYSESKLAIDLEHRAVMRECLGEKMQVPPVYDIRA